MSQIVIQNPVVQIESGSRVRARGIGLWLLTAAGVGATYLSAVESGSPALLTLGVVVMAALVGAQGVRTDCGWNAASRLVIPGPYRPSTVVSAHVAGIAVGSSVTAAAIALLALAVPDIGAAWLGVSFVVIGVLRTLRHQTVLPGGWKVRRSWERWGAVRYMLVFGFFLGLGFVTTVVSPSFLLMIAWSLAGANAFVPLVVFGGFAAGRIGTTIAAAAGDAVESSVACLTVDTVRARIAPLGYIEGGIAVAIGLCLVLGVSA